VPERAHLAVTARRRVRRVGALLAALGVLAAVGMVGYLLKMQADLPPDRDPTRLWLVGSLAVVLVVLSFAVPVIALRERARHPELLLGAGRSTRKAVLRALRDGHTPDPHIDALAREAARHQMHLLRGWRRYLPWFFCAMAVLFLAGMTLGLMSEPSTPALVALALGSIALGVGGPHLFLSIRRSRRYLDKA